jgi:hypothetical protein
MNNVIMHFDSKYLNMYPYVFEFSSMIKNKSISKQQTKCLLTELSSPDFQYEFKDHVKQTLKKLELSEEDIIYDL